MGREKLVVNADLLMSHIYHLKVQITREAKYGWETEVRQLDFLRDMVSKGHWNQVIVSISG